MTTTSVLPLAKLCIQTLVNYNEKITNEDIKLLTERAVELLVEGWTVNEVIRFFSFFEEVNPNIDEEISIRNIKLIRKQVEARLTSKY